MIQACASATRATGKVIGLSTASNPATAINGTVCATVLSVHSLPARRSDCSLARGRQ
jgi:hypothetical protein